MKSSNFARRPRVLPFVVVVAGIVFLFMGLFFANFRTEGLQSNGLSVVQYPFSGYAYLMYSVTLALILFSIVFSIITRNTNLQLRLTITTAGLLASGLIIISFLFFVREVLEADYAGRCVALCEPFLQADASVALGLIGAIVFGVVLVGAGVWLERGFPRSTLAKDPPSS